MKVLEEKELVKAVVGLQIVQKAEAARWRDQADQIGKKRHLQRCPLEQHAGMPAEIRLAFEKYGAVVSGFGEQRSQAQVERANPDADHIENLAGWGCASSRLHRSGSRLGSAARRVRDSMRTVVCDMSVAGFNKVI